MNDLLILACLLDGPLHGYALKNRVGAITGHGPLHNNLVYPLLKRFVSASWVSRRKAPGQRGRTREIYSLTPKGKQALLSKLAAFTEKDASSSDAFRFRVALFAVLDPQQRAEILDSRARWLARRAAILDDVARSMRLDPWAEQTVRFLRTQVLAEEKWLGSLRKLAKNGPQDLSKRLN